MALLTAAKIKTVNEKPLYFLVVFNAKERQIKNPIRKGPDPTKRSIMNEMQLRRNKIPATRKIKDVFLFIINCSNVEQPIRLSHKQLVPLLMLIHIQVYDPRPFFCFSCLQNQTFLFANSKW